MRLAGPIHFIASAAIRHIVHERGADIPGDINCLNFKGTKIIYFPCFIICDQNNIYIAGRFSVVVNQTNLGKRRPRYISAKKEIGCIICNQPIFPKPNRTSDYGHTFIIYTTYTQRIFCFIFCATRNFIIKRAKSSRTVAFGLFTGVSDKVAKHLRQWLLLISHAILFRGGGFGLTGLAR